MSGQVNLNTYGILDEDLPTLLENVFKCLSNHLDLVSTRNGFNNEIRLRDDIVIPNEICDRFVHIFNIILYLHKNNNKLSCKCTNINE